MNRKVKEYLESDRQWLRVHRIAHAEYQLKKSTIKEDKIFWKAVLEANKL